MPNPEQQPEDVRRVQYNQYLSLLKLEITDLLASAFLHSAFGIKPGCAILLPIFKRRRMHE